MGGDAAVVTLDGPPAVVSPASAGWNEVLAFLDAVADPVEDLLLFADVVSDLASLSTVWAARRDGAVTAVAFSFPLHPQRPALGVKGRTAADEAAVIRALSGSGAWGQGYVIAPHAQRPAWLACGQAAPSQDEAHMVRQAAGWVAPPAVPGVRPATLAEVDAFYRTHGAAAWNPAQFATGPYVVAEEAGEVVAAAGTHFACPALAQIGNVLTAPAARGRGWARACTAAVADGLIARGHPTLSLFVAVDNAPARRVYEGLGFKAIRTLAAFGWEAGAVSP